MKKHKNNSDPRLKHKHRNRILIISICVLVGIAACTLYAVIHDNTYNASIAAAVDTKTPAPIDTPKVSEAPLMLTPSTSTNAIKDAFGDLLQQNEDTVGYIKIESTRVDYPIVQSEDNKYYLDKAFDGNTSKAGTIFMDFNNDVRTVENYGNIVLYGHNMKNGSMFADLINYKNEEFFNQHRIIEFNTLYGDYKWEVFSVYVTDTSTNYAKTVFRTQASFEKFLIDCTERSMHQSNVQLTKDDTILTLSTCTYEFKDARFTVQARLLKK